MSIEPKHDGSEENPRGGRAPIRRRRVEWAKISVLVAALSGLWIAQGLAIWSDDPSAGGVVLWVTSLMVASLVALGLAIQSLLASVQSPLRHVFGGRQVLAFGSFLAIITAILAWSIVQRNPFHGVITNGHITAADVADGGFVVAVMVCATGTCIAFASAWDALRDERAWHASLGVPRR